MNTINRKTSAIAGLLALGFLGTLTVHAAEKPAVAAEATQPACHQEARRVAVWPKAGNPKLMQIPRFEARMLTVCNHEMKKSMPESSAKHDRDPAQLDSAAAQHAKLAAYYRALASAGSKQGSAFLAIADHCEREADSYREAAAADLATGQSDREVAIVG